MNPLEFSQWYRFQYHTSDRRVGDLPLIMSVPESFFAYMEAIRKVREYMQSITPIITRAAEQLADAFYVFGEAISQAFITGFKPFFDATAEFWQMQKEYSDKSELVKARQRSNFKDIRNLNLPDQSQRSRRTTYWWGGWRRK